MAGLQPGHGSEQVVKSGNRISDFNENVTVETCMQNLARSLNGRVATRPLRKASTCMRISRDLPMPGPPSRHWEKCRPQSSEPWPDPRCCSSRRFARGLRSRSSCRRALLVVAAHVRARLQLKKIVVGAVASNVNMEKLRTPRAAIAVRQLRVASANQRLLERLHGWCSKHFPATCCSCFHAWKHTLLFQREPGRQCMRT